LEIFLMLGLMQSQQLLISSMIDFAERHHSEGEIVSRRVEGDIHRCTYKDIAKRSRKVAKMRSFSSTDIGLPAPPYQTTNTNHTRAAPSTTAISISPSLSTVAQHAAPV
jgi:hypothetical protein